MERREVSAPVRFTVLKASGRLRAGATVECRAGAALPAGAAGEAFALADVPGPLRYCARVVPVPAAAAEAWVRALSPLGHPNVIAPLGAGERGDDAVVVQETPEGVALTGWLAQQRSSGRVVSLPDVERILRQVVTALRHAHQAEICHGGLTSSHVFLTPRAGGDFQVQVTDFGLVPLLAAHAAGPPTDAWWHLAPEVAERPAEATPRADLFALGVLLVELLTGLALVPPTGTTPWRAFARARTASIRATIAQARPDAPDALVDLATSLLHPHPHERAPATVIEVSRQLPRIVWEPRARPTALDEIIARDEPPPPPQTLQRPETLPPSRHFVVSGASFSRAVAATEAGGASPVRASTAAPVAPRITPTPPPTPPLALPVPAPAIARPAAPPATPPTLGSIPTDDDPTFLDGDAAPPALPAMPPSPPRAAMSSGAPSSWFATEPTVITPPIVTVLSDDDATLDKGLASPLAPGESTLPEEAPARASTPAGALRGGLPATPSGGFFAAEGTEVLAHPDQLASARDASASEGSAPDRAAPAPDLTAPAPVPDLAARIFAVESTQPEFVVPARRGDDDGPGHDDALAPGDPELLAHRALLVAVVVAAGAVLGLIIWGVMLSGRTS